MANGPIETNGYDRKEMANISICVLHVKTSRNIWFRFISNRTICNSSAYDSQRAHTYSSIKWAGFFMLLNLELI